MRADWENQAITKRLTLAYDVASLPEFWYVSVALPDMTDKRNVFSPGDPLKGSRSLLDIEFLARIVTTDSVNVNTAGFVAAWIGYYSSPVNPFDPVSIGNQIPTALDNTALRFMSSESFIPTSLPISGIDHPIWTTPAIDPLTCRTYINDRDNPGYLWGVAWVQVNGNTNTPTAATLDLELRWDYAGESQR